MYMNSHEIVDTMNRFADETSTPILRMGAIILARLYTWTNRNSDGWAYWPKPVRAAKNLMVLLQDADRWEPEDVTLAELRKACVPIKSFLTRQGVDHSVVFGTDTI